MSQLTPMNNPFLFDQMNIRTALDEHGTPWFVAKDVFEALDIAWRGLESLKNIPEEWQQVWIMETAKGARETIYLSEPAVYQVAFRSSKPEAVSFTKWVCEEVLPALRRQGFYGTMSAGQLIQLRSQKLAMLKQLETKDAFIFESVVTSLRNVCNLLGEPMPDINLLGKDRRQLGLELE